jgi:VanZ family protein
MKGFHLLALYLFWPAVALVVWGELSSGGSQIELAVWDKALHFTAYFGLAGMVCLALNADRRVIAATLGLILFGGVLEILQGFTGRDPDLYDELANTLGALTGAALGWIIVQLLRPKALAPTRGN